MKNSSFLKTTLFLTLLTAVERLLGFCYRIFLSNRLGEELLGVYQVSLSVFGVFLTLGAGGLPITVSRFFTRFKANNDLKNQNSTLSAGLFIGVCASFLPAILFWLFGSLFSNLLPDERCLPTLNILLIGGVFSSLFAVLRGRLWGENNFLTPSLFELFEQGVLVLSGILFLCLDIAVPLLERVAWANALSCALGFFCALGFCIFQKKGFGSPLPIAKELFIASLPITAVRIFSALLTSIVAILLPRQLVLAGYTETQAVKIYGVLTGMTLPVLFIPATIIGSLSLVLAPKISEDFYKKNTANLKKNVEKGLTLTLFLSELLIPLVFLLGEDLGGLLFSSVTAGEMIKTGSPILLPMSLSMLSTSLMNALGNQKATLKYYLFGAVGLLISILIFTEPLGGYSYLIGMGLSFGLAAAFNLFFLWKRKLIATSFFKKLLLCCALLLPVTLFGQLVKSLCVKTLGAYFSVALIGLETLGFAIVAWFYAQKPSFKQKKL